MKKLKILAMYLLVAAFSNSCAPIKKEYDVHLFYGEEVSPYVKEFMSRYRKHYRYNANISVIIDERGEYTNLYRIGLCKATFEFTQEGVYSKGVVYLNRYFWDMAGHEDKMTLVFHELGHCVLGLDHDENIPFMTVYHRAVPMDDEFDLKAERFFKSAKIKNK